MPDVCLQTGTLVQSHILPPPRFRFSLFVDIALVMELNTYILISDRNRLRFWNLAMREFITISLNCWKKNFKMTRSCCRKYTNM